MPQQMEHHHAEGKKQCTIQTSVIYVCHYKLIEHAILCKMYINGTLIQYRIDVSYREA